MVDHFDPKVEGLEAMEQKRRVTAMITILSKEPIDPSKVGYQEPEPKEDKPER